MALGSKQQAIVDQMRQGYSRLGAHTDAKNRVWYALQGGVKVDGRTARRLITSGLLIKEEDGYNDSYVTYYVLDISIVGESWRVFNGIYENDARIMGCRIEVWKRLGRRHLTLKCIDSRGKTVFVDSMSETLVAAQLRGGTFWDNFTPLTKLRTTK